jgi:hypothetical protein
VGRPLLQLSLLQAHWGRWRYTHLLRQLVYLQFTWEVPFPALQWNPPPDTVTSFPAPGCWAWAATPAFSGQLVYLQFRERLSLPHSLELRVPRPLCYASFCCCCCLFSLFSLFSLGGGSVCPGGYADLAQGCLWDYRVPLGSPDGLLVPCWLGAGVSRCESPPGFSIYRGVGMLCMGWGVEVSEFYLFLVYFQRLSKILL